MVFVPKTKFTMGSDDGGREETPPHPVVLSAILVDRHEVSNVQFAKFVAETGYRTDAEKEGRGLALVGDIWPDVEGADWRHPRGPGSSIDGKDFDPVVLVSWNDARAYADWAGRRLLTEAEFEMCLRGSAQGCTYPWGEEDVPPGRPGNYADETLRRAHPHAKWAKAITEDYEDGFERAARVGSFPQNAFGLFDMSGNVWEWCGDWFDEAYYSASPATDPQGPSSGGFRVRRGGGWNYSGDPLRCSFRDSSVPGYRWDVLGFRCAMSVP